MANRMKFNSPEEMQEKIDAYFKDCEGELLTGDDGHPIFDKYGEPIRLGVKPLTVTGLALALGFTTRQALLNYQGRGAYKAIIEAAKLKIENYAEMRLYDRDGWNGARFNLQNNFRAWDADKPAQGDKKAPAINLFQRILAVLVIAQRQIYVPMIKLAAVANVCSAHADTHHILPDVGLVALDLCKLFLSNTVDKESALQFCLSASPICEKSKRGLSGWAISSLSLLHFCLLLFQPGQSFHQLIHGLLRSALAIQNLGNIGGVVPAFLRQHLSGDPCNVHTPHGLDDSCVHALLLLSQKVKNFCLNS